MNRSPDEAIARLPPHVLERCRLLGRGAPPAIRDYVLYWMHHAVRGHENPALDAAIAIANDLDLPVLVYQGLGGSHPFNNDRHHTFILQGARDAHRELQARGVRAVFHLDRRGERPSPLRRLVRRAAALIVEDFPAPPFPTWTSRLAAVSPAPVIAVDCFCLVPMQSQPRSFGRAYEYRRHNRSELERRVPLTWPDMEVEQAMLDTELGFVPLDLARADFSELCAQCAIDHSVPPVAHTIGGSRAGYARWERFRDVGLATYARERNDAAADWPRGVSRLSPYIHHGQVSPLRIAREAWQAGGTGAEKFLDELLIWRELAYNFCFFTENPGVVDALPRWARETLDAHAADPRPVIEDPESLARSATGDELWDLAQTSLRIHGELHNNLRMTWAKAVLQWRPDPRSALDILIELNHRFALDGSDPSSYGGILWALGLFDRPFPESAVVGKLRDRSTRSHARRMDLARYGRRVARPSTGRIRRVAVIGGGISGLTAARILQDHGHEVTLFEKSLGPGGRAATRRVETVGFDHGAQYFTARDTRFLRTVEAWRENGVVDTWNGRIGQVRHGQVEASADNQERYVGVPGMSAIGRHLATDLTIHTRVRVAPPERIADRWRLHSETGEELGDFDLLIVAVPAPQAQALLLPSAPLLAQQAGAVEYASAWALMLALATDPPLPYDGLFFDCEEIGWAARNSSKPGREGNTWVVHAAPAWTHAHLETPGEKVAAELICAFADYTGIDPSGILMQDTHRWLYSLVPNPLQVGALWDRELAVGLCGDWCQGARVEGAYLSGQAIAGRILGGLAAAETQASESHSA